MIKIIDGNGEILFNSDEIIKKEHLSLIDELLIRIEEHTVIKEKNDNEKLELGELYENLALEYYYAGMYVESKESNYKALSLYEELSEKTKKEADYTRLLRIYNELAFLYFAKLSNEDGFDEQKLVEKSIDYYNKVISLYPKAESSCNRLVVYGYLNLISAYNQIEQYEHAYNKLDELDAFKFFLLSGLRGETDKLNSIYAELKLNILYNNKKYAELLNFCRAYLSRKAELLYIVQDYLYEERIMRLMCSTLINIIKNDEVDPEHKNDIFNMCKIDINRASKQKNQVSEIECYFDKLIDDDSIDQDIDLDI